jgi:hypothetical protein
MAPKTKKDTPPMGPKSREMVKKSFRLDATHVRRAEELALQKGVDLSAIIQMALAEKLERDLK